MFKTSKNLAMLQMQGGFRHGVSIQIGEESSWLFLLV